MSVQRSNNLDRDRSNSPGNSPGNSGSPLGKSGMECLACGQQSRCVRTIPSLGILPELHVFQCPACRSVTAAPGREYRSIN